MIKPNENAWAFTYLLCFQNCTVLLAPKSLFVIDWETHIHSLCTSWRHWHHDVIPWPHVISWCRSVMSHEVTPYAIMISHGNSLQAEAWKSHFLTLWPWPLTYELDLQFQPNVKVNFHTKNQGHRSNSLAVRVFTDRHTHRSTDDSNSMTLTADVGCKNKRKKFVKIFPIKIKQSQTRTITKSTVLRKLPVQ